MGGGSAATTDARWRLLFNRRQPAHAAHELAVPCFDFLLPHLSRAISSIRVLLRFETALWGVLDAGLVVGNSRCALE